MDKSILAQIQLKLDESVTLATFLGNWLISATFNEAANLELSFSARLHVEPESDLSPLNGSFINYDNAENIGAMYP